MREVNLYVIEHDRRLPSNGASLQWPERMLQGYDHAAEEEIVYVKSGQSFSSSSLLAQYPLLLLSEELSKIVMKFAPEITSKRVVVMDTEKYNQSFYHWMDLPKATCISPDQALIQSGQVMSIMADLSGLERTPAFTIPYYRTQLMIVRLELAERLLRAGIYGLNVRPIQITEGDM
ncbi:hypothetical protein PAECIP112173_01487 [Paenibacillus sp. JJ-100]|uniref:hypothetical protein n=1 Tax=Paenibacillus sp. JJ-100 TaxID=2974896 RepID=UPI0022FF4FE6|nr:hypothetical protein [Paenibacillus sp. JJ-100]CAI6053475.1 hypothetical protein PAECIP112173_01487 [Paenibacillus sp. JJ-100]